MKTEIHNQPHGLVLFQRKTNVDERGLFQKAFSPEELPLSWGDRKVCQINRSVTKNSGAFRGFHFQNSPFSEMKLIQCLRGRVLDIVIDLRADSQTFLKTFFYELSEANNMCVVVPEGLAHGFQTLEDNSELLYIHSAPYKKEFEGGVHYEDPLFDIQLPLPIKEVSVRDKSFKFLDKNFKGLK